MDARTRKTQPSFPIPSYRSDSTLKCGTHHNLAGKPRDERHVRGRNEF